MKEKILALLVEKFKGVRKDGLTALASAMALQCTTEDEAKALVDKVTDAQVTEFVKDYRADVDKEVSESNKTYETNLRKKYDFKEKKTEPGGDPTKKDDIAAIVREAVAEAVKPYQEKFSSYEQKDLAEKRLHALNEKLANCKDETFKSQILKDFARIQFADENAFNEYLNEKATDIETANQNVANQGLGGAGTPLFSKKTEDGVSQGVSEYLAAQNPEKANVAMTGKEL